MSPVIMSQEQSQYNLRGMKPYFKKYYLENRETILENAKENAKKRADIIKSVIRCECCDTEITRGCYPRHRRSKMHIENADKFSIEQLKN